MVLFNKCIVTLDAWSDGDLKWKVKGNQTPKKLIKGIIQGPTLPWINPPGSKVPRKAIWGDLFILKPKVIMRVLPTCQNFAKVISNQSNKKLMNQNQSWNSSRFISHHQVLYTISILEFSLPLSSSLFLNLPLILSVRFPYLRGTGSLSRELGTKFMFLAWK